MFLMQCGELLSHPVPGHNALPSGLITSNYLALTILATAILKIASMDNTWLKLLVK